MSKKAPTPPPHIAPAVNGKPVIDQPQADYNPGQATGIIGLVLAFAGLAPVGLVLSIVSTIQSKKANAPTLLGVLGIIFNTIAALALAFLITIFAFAVQNYYNFETQDDDTSMHTSAMQVVKKAEAYHSFYGKYPQTISDFEVQKETSLHTIAVAVESKTPEDTNTIQYKACGKGGAKIVYVVPSEYTLHYEYLGNGNPDTCLDKQNEA